MVIVAMVAPRSVSSAAAPVQPDAPATNTSFVQSLPFASYQIHHNVAGMYRNHGGLGANDQLLAEVAAMQDPGPDTDPPGAIFLNESCLDIVEALRETLQNRFDVTYTLAFHNHLMFLPDGTSDDVCIGLQNENQQTEGTLEPSPFGVAVLQLGAGGTAFPDSSEMSPGPPPDPENPGDWFDRAWLFDNQHPTDGEPRGFACVVGAAAGHGACTAHMNYKRIAPSDEDPGDPEYDPDDDTIYPAVQFSEYWAEVADLGDDENMPVIWSADAYRTPDEIATENPGFYTENVEADSSGCPGPAEDNRATVVNENGSQDKVDHIFITNIDPVSCTQADVQPPIDLLCDFVPEGAGAVVPAQATTTSTTIPDGETDCLPAGAPEWRGTATNGQFDHRAIRSHFDLGLGDTQAPTTTASVDPPANGAGWHTGPVAVELSATDDLSGVESITYQASGAQTVPSTTAPGNSASLMISAEGVTTVEYSARDRAGNIETTKTLVVRIDQTPPTVTGTADRPPDSGDWYNAPFTVDWTGADTGSGVASCDPPVTYSGPDTTASALSGQCTDVAGNTGTGTFTVRYDASAPLVAAVADRGPDFNGWYNEPLTVAFYGADETSGIDSCDPPAVYDGPDGENLAVAGACVDNAGNTATGTYSPFRYDNTLPTSSISGGAVQVIVNATDPSMSGNAADDLAGIWLIAVEFENTLNPNDTETRIATCPTDCLGQSSTTWTVDTTGLLGVYNVRVTAADLAGNPGSSSSTVIATII